MTSIISLLFANLVLEIAIYLFSFYPQLFSSLVVHLPVQITWPFIVLLNAKFP
jgi:hypothetical protein